MRVVVVRRDSIEVKRYEEVLDSSRVLMREKIIGKEVRIVSKEEALSSDFADFCLRAMSGGKASGNSVGLSCLMSAMGYIMSGYKILKGKRKMPIEILKRLKEEYPMMDLNYIFSNLDEEENISMVAEDSAVYFAEKVYRKKLLEIKNIIESTNF